MYSLFEYAPIKYAYIDPGTGSMLFTILIGLLSVLHYGFRSFINKLRFMPSRIGKENDRSPFVIYTDSKRYWNVFQSICDVFEKNKTELKYLTQSDDDPVFDREYKYIHPEYIGNNNKSFSKLNYLKADVLLSSTPSLDVFQWKRSDNVKWYIHIPHMCSDITYYRLFGIDYYDAVLTTGDYQNAQVRELEKLRNLPSKELRTVGLTYFDDMKKRLDSSPAVKNDNTVVLVAPSWGPSSLLNLYGKDLIDSLLLTGYHIIIRPHPQSFVSEKEMIDELSSKYPDLEWNRDNDNFDVLHKADIMISDFSGVIFDFALIFDKPVIYANYQLDDSVYDAHWLNEETWTFKTLPKIGKELKKEDFSSLKQVIDECLTDPEYFEGRRLAKEEAWQNQGKAAIDIYNYMVSKQKELGGIENEHRNDSL